MVGALTGTSVETLVCASSFGQWQSGKVVVSGEVLDATGRSSHGLVVGCSEKSKGRRI